MKQEDFELEAKDAAKAMLKKKAPTRPETFERPRQTGKRLTPRGKDGELETGVPTIDDMLLVNLPEGVTLLPENWEGKSERAWMRLTLSKQAIENEKFPMRAFVKAKFNNSLTAIRKRKNMEQLCLTHYFCMTVDTVSDKRAAIFHIYIEYAI